MRDFDRVSGSNVGARNADRADFSKQDFNELSPRERVAFLRELRNNSERLSSVLKAYSGNNDQFDRALSSALTTILADNKGSDNVIIDTLLKNDHTTGGVLANLENAPPVVQPVQIEDIVTNGVAARKSGSTADDGRSNFLAKILDTTPPSKALDTVLNKLEVMCKNDVWTNKATTAAIKTFVADITNDCAAKTKLNNIVTSYSDANRAQMLTYNKSQDGSGVIDSSDIAGMRPDKAKDFAILTMTGQSTIQQGEYELKDIVDRLGNSSTYKLEVFTAAVNTSNSTLVDNYINAGLLDGLSVSQIRTVTTQMLGKGLSLNALINKIATQQPPGNNQKEMLRAIGNMLDNNAYNSLDSNSQTLLNNALTLSVSDINRMPRAEVAKYAEQLISDPANASGKDPDVTWDVILNRMNSSQQQTFFNNLVDSENPEGVIDDIINNKELLQKLQTALSNREAKDSSDPKLIAFSENFEARITSSLNRTAASGSSAAVTKAENAGNAQPAASVSNFTHYTVDEWKDKLTKAGIPQDLAGSLAGIFAETNIQGPIHTTTAIDIARNISNGISELNTVENANTFFRGTLSGQLSKLTQFGITQSAIDTLCGEKFAYFNLGEAPNTSIYDIASPSEETTIQDRIKNIFDGIVKNELPGHNLRKQILGGARLGSDLAAINKIRGQVATREFSAISIGSHALSAAEQKDDFYLGFIITHQEELTVAEDGTITTKFNDVEISAKLTFSAEELALARDSKDLLLAKLLASRKESTIDYLVKTKISSSTSAVPEGTDESGTLDLPENL
jgi:hypothetical protein